MTNDEQQAGVGPTPTPPPPPPTAEDDEPVLPRVAAEDAEVGWGARAPAAAQSDPHDEWLRDQRPPHHGG